MAEFDTSDDGQVAESAIGYNPIFQKRVTLGIDRTPGGGYHYYGPPPDAGTSYGSWFDQANKIGVIGVVNPDGTMMFSPASGDEMQYEGPANNDMKDAILSYQGEYHMLPASQSGHTCLTTAAVYEREVPAMFNPYSGEDITEAYLAMKAQRAKKQQTTPKENTMKIQTKKATVAAASDGPAQKSFKPKSLSVPKVGQKSIPYSKDGDSLKPASMSGVDSAKDGLNKATNSHGSDEPEQEKTVKQSSIKPAGDIKVPDVGMDKLPHASNASTKRIEAMSDDELVAALESHLAKADGDDSEAPKLSIELEPGSHVEPDGDECPPPPPPPSDSAELPPEVSAPPVSESASDPVMDPASAPHEEVGPDGSSMHSESDEDEPQIPVLESPASEKAMPLAHVQLVRKLRATAAALRAGVKVEKAEQNVLMAQAVKVLKGAKVERPKAADPQTAALMQSIRDLTSTVSSLSRQVAAIRTPAVSAAPVKAEDVCDTESDDKKVEEIMKDKGGEKAEESAEGVHFEVLQSLDSIEQEGITAASVSCHLYAEGGVNPFWNVTVHGEPLARIYLQDQERPDEIKALFTSPMYGEALAKASEQVEGGLRKLLNDAGARFFTLQLDKAEVAQKAKAAAVVEAKKVISERLATLSDRFLESMATAAIGMDRNFFQGGNPLKHAFAENLNKVGVPIDQAIDIIEASFADGSAEYFKTLAKKASELMAMEPAAFDQLRSSIIEAGTIKPVVSEEAVTASVSAGTSMVQHLVEQSNAIAGVSMSVMGGAEPLSEKEQLRRELGLGSSSFRR
jgi:arsenate reductase-like glutaredoxin family protein